MSSSTHLHQALTDTEGTVLYEMPSSTYLHQALTDSLSSGIFIDTKFFLFSKRKYSTGRVSLSFPGALYANSSILKRIKYFETGK
jgi:hypothetical protein